ncbi:cytochrome c oxidase subunit I [Chelativorans sp. ZYF759]|uniref:cytochrome c oxidase subunit I n=1 Tax=Chelativorans sp. ZYF759 TaxID=2692213 RepID=UPI00145FC93E|nr:cytochrome c oxidase subunit I [Chelativorans sp. ZYF759]NMG40454.1 cytochrome c oxidase subunit I [Chelativorans sp. ZYF759]
MNREPERLNPIALHRQLAAIWDSGKGLQRLGAVNHTVLGKRFMVTAFVFFAIGGVLAMLIRAQLATPHSAFMDAATYNQIFTMHGTVMMFLFAIPMLEGAAIYFLPKMLGARDLAFPRLTALGYWCYLFGGTIIIVAMLAGVAPDSGWFMYTPLSSRPFSPGVNADVWLLGITFVEISAVCAAIEITVSILKLRAPGMSLDKMPIFGWYMLVTALMMIFGFPPLILASILLEVERAFDFPFFDPTRGGDSLLWAHLFWLFGHPEVYIIFLPAAGAVSMILPVLARNPLMGYRAIIVALIAMAFLSFGIWVHHMFTLGIPHLALAFFSAASALVAIPTGIQIFAWIATLAHGRPRFEIPMLYIFGFLVVFVAGGLTGVMLAMVPFNWQAHDTHFVVAHLHYVLVGGFVFPMLAAAYYWLPQVTGRLPVFKLSIPAFWLIFIGFNMTFFMMHITGLRGMPRRVFTYPADIGWDWLNLLSSVGGFILTMGFALFVIDVVLQLRFGKPFRRNPWGAGTLEWAQPTPPPSYNFASLPTVDRRADTLDAGRMGAELAGGRGYLGFARNGWMETLAVDMTTGRPEHVVLLPNNSMLPLWTSLAIGGFVLSLLFQFYLFSLVPLALVLVLALSWTRTTGQRADRGPIPIGRGEMAPTHYEISGAPSWWGMVFTLFANGTLFASLLFGALFLWAVAPNWPPPSTGEIGLVAPVLVLLAFALAAGTNHLAVAANRRGGSPLLWLALCAAAHLTAVIVLVWCIRNVVPDPTSHAYAAVCFILLAYAALHSSLGAVFAFYGFERFRQGYVSAVRSLDLRIGSLWHDYTAGTGAIAVILVVLMPALVAMGAWQQ